MGGGHRLRKRERVRGSRREPLVWRKRAPNNAPNRQRGLDGQSQRAPAPSTNDPRDLPPTCDRPTIALSNRWGMGEKRDGKRAVLSSGHRDALADGCGEV